MLCSLNILQNCTKLDANGWKEMLHFNKFHIVAIYLLCLVDRKKKIRPNIEQQGIQLTEIMTGI